MVQLHLKSDLRPWRGDGPHLGFPPDEPNCGGKKGRIVPCEPLQDAGVPIALEAVPKLSTISYEEDDLEEWVAATTVILVW